MTSERVRAFFALPLPEAFERAAVEAQALLRRRSSHSRLSLRFLPADHLHVTLKFLGYVSASDLFTLGEELSQAAQRFSPIELESGTLDAFPTMRRGRVIVAHLDDRERRIAALSEACEAIAESLGISRETRPFRAHVTLARLSAPGDVHALLEKVPFPKQPIRFERVRLYRSTLLPTGSLYSVIAEAPLRDPAPT